VAVAPPSPQRTTAANADGNSPQAFQIPMPATDTGVAATTRRVRAGVESKSMVGWWIRPWSQPSGEVDNLIATENIAPSGKSWRAAQYPSSVTAQFHVPVEEFQPLPDGVTRSNAPSVILTGKIDALTSKSESLLEPRTYVPFEVTVTM
jgi:hypothetical protein